MGEKSEERAPPWVTWSKKGKPCKGATNRGDLCHARFGADRICVYLPRALPWAGLSKAFGLCRRSLTKRWFVSSGQLWRNQLGMMLFHYCSA